MSTLADLDPSVAYPATETAPDSPRHSWARFLAYGALSAHFAGDPETFVGHDLNVYYRQLPDRRVVAPDVLVCFGVDAGAIGEDVSYRLWDAGAPPAFVLEIASGKTHRRDLEDKPGIYLEVGADEYWRFDPSGLGLFDPVLQGDRRVGDSWAPIPVRPDGDGRLSGHSAVLGLDLHAEDRRLRFRDPQTGRWLPDPDDTQHTLDLTRRQMDAAEARAAAAEARAAAAEDRAAAAEAETAALRARLNDET